MCRTSRSLALLCAAIALGGCRQDMNDQAKLEPFEASRFFADGRASRPLVEGTVPRGRAAPDPWLEQGRAPDGSLAAEFPFPVTKAVLGRGRERYEIYCAPCHARTGDGDGMVVRRGYRRPPSFHEARLRAAPAGHFVDAIANGFGAMPDHAAQVPPPDRWAIAAYIRALQLSRNATIADVPEKDRAKLEGGRPR